MGAIGGIVLDNTADSAAAASPIFAMSGDGSDDVSIPMVFLFSLEAKQLIQVSLSWESQKYGNWKRKLFLLSKKSVNC